MKKILNIFEEEEEKELTDYEKILALNKRKIDPYDTDFDGCDGEDYSDYYEVGYDGITFTFHDGLEEYLRFFFKETYGDEGTDGWYEAGYLDSMRRGQWEWDTWDRASEDWDEGYTVESLKGESLKLLYEILEKYQPHLLNSFEVMDNHVRWKDGKETDKINDFIESVSRRAKDDLIEAYSYANDSATDAEVPGYIDEMYCNCLSVIGIENQSKNCYWKYYLSWGDAIMLFVRYGTPEDCLMDIMFKAVEKEVTKHTPEYYEIQYEAWNREVFDKEYNRRSIRVLESLMEDLDEMVEEGGEEKMKKYFQILNTLSEKTGFNTNKKIPGGYEIRVFDVDKDTLMVNYGLRKGNTWGESFKKGSSPLRRILDMLVTPPIVPYID
jgi:hypothetical protein